MPQPARSTRLPFGVTLYATPTRGAKFVYVVLHKKLPGAARAICAGFVTFSQAERDVPFRPDGAGFSSQRRPYTSVSRELICQVSWPNRLVALNRKFVGF